MIAVDTSALMALLLNEPECKEIKAILESSVSFCISAATVSEALIVARRRNIGDEMASLLDGLGFEIEPVTKPVAEAAADTYDRWRKGVHPAALNFGDCFAYVLAKSRNCPLLFVGDDFAKTDIVSALGNTGRTKHP